MRRNRSKALLSRKAAVFSGHLRARGQFFKSRLDARKNPRPVWMPYRYCEGRRTPTMTTPQEMSSGSRRLAAVWFADIVGFTRLAAENETLALRLVETLQAAATAAVEAHEGKIVKFMGDDVLAEFASAKGGAVGGMQLLLRFGQLTEGWPEGPHQLRLGMHLGDVTVAADGDIYGDGVNRASRLDGLAEPGKLLVSEDVYRQLRSRPDLILTGLGSHQVKGYDEPLRVYDAEPTAELTRSLLREAATPAAPAEATRPRRSVRPIAVGLGVGILTFATLAVWTALGTPSSDTPLVTSPLGPDGSLPRPDGSAGTSTSRGRLAPVGPRTPRRSPRAPGQRRTADRTRRLHGFEPNHHDPNHFDPDHRVQRPAADRCGRANALSGRQSRSAARTTRQARLRPTAVPPPQSTPTRCCERSGCPPTDSRSER